jgi:hypothetical protein
MEGPRKLKTIGNCSRVIHMLIPIQQPQGIDNLCTELSALNAIVIKIRNGVWHLPEIRIDIDFIGGIPIIGTDD